MCKKRFEINCLRTCWSTSIMHNTKRQKGQYFFQSMNIKNYSGNCWPPTICPSTAWKNVPIFGGWLCWFPWFDGSEPPINIVVLPYGAARWKWTVPPWWARWFREFLKKKLFTFFFVSLKDNARWWMSRTRIDFFYETFSATWAS